MTPPPESDPQQGRPKVLHDPIIHPGPERPHDERWDEWGPAVGQRVEHSSIGEAVNRMEAVLAGFSSYLGRDRERYGNHVRRVFGLVLSQGDALTTEQVEQVAIAAAFHDIGIWVDGTFDYLEPSRDHAAEYLHAEGLSSWVPEVSALILKHHKLRPVRNEPLVEAFRRADLCDVSLGTISRGIPSGRYKELVEEFPIKGFHGFLIAQTAKRAVRHPLSPLPMLRW